MKYIFTFLSFLFLSNQLSAQFIPVNFPLADINGNNLRNAWAGGMNLPQFSAVDLNNDGIDDLVVFDRDSKTATPFLNNGTANQVDYHFAPEFTDRLPQGISNYMLFRDYDCDGIMDIFMHWQRWGQGAGMAVMKGSYDVDNKIQFAMVKDVLTYDTGGPFLNTIFIFNTDIPAIDDVDGDGDLDILCFTLNFSFPRNVFYYKNMSAENGFGCDSLDYRLENECFGQFEETGIQSICKFSPGIDSCRDNPYWLPNDIRPLNTQSQDELDRNARHIGATLTTVDYNGDGVKDLLLGGVSYRNLNMVTATKVNDTILMVSQDTFFPSYDVPTDIFTFPSSYILDVNNDGIVDLIAAPTETGICEAIKDSVAWYYQNTGTNTNMQFAFQQKNFLVNEMLDIGEGAYPAIADVTGDGLLDIIIGGAGRCQDGGLNLAGNYLNGLSLLENTGSANNPSFRLATYNYALLDSIPKNNMHPAFGDLDGDGDLDLILGSIDGTITYLQNTAGVGMAATWANPIYNWMGIDVSDNAAPTLADLDRDGDLDLICGDYGGKVKFYENKGNATSPVFINTPVTNLLSGYDMNTYYGRHAAPNFYDNSGSWEMFLGQQNGNIAHFDNIDNNVYGVYDTLSEAFGGIANQYSDIAIADLNNDGFLDYVIGGVKGGLTIYTHKDYLLSKESIASMVIPNFQLFPNPAKEELNLSLNAPLQEAAAVQILNTLGQEVGSHTINKGETLLRINLQGLSPGVYYVYLQNNEKQKALPFIKQ